MNKLTDNRTIDFRYELLDKNDLLIGNVDVTNAKIIFNSDSEVMRSARFTLISKNELNLLDKKIKAYFVHKKPKGDDLYPLGVFMITTPSVSNTGGLFYTSVECYDKTLILKEDKFDTRYRVAAGTNYIDAVIAIIYTAGIYKIDKTDCSLALAADMEFEIGTTKLDAINKLLKAVNYNFIHFDENGTAIIKPYTSYYDMQVTKTYLADKESVIKTDGSKESDIFNLPNKIVRYTETPEKACLKAVYTNTDLTSKISLPNRGRTICDVQKVDDIADQATLNAYVNRVAQNVTCYETLTFNTCLMPEHGLYECLRVRIDDLGINSKYAETAWEMELEVGGNMKHVCKKIVEI